jgi:hypothetical protein
LAKVYKQLAPNGAFNLSLCWSAFQQSSTNTTRRVYRTVIQAAAKYPGKPFEEIEDDAALDYERNKAGSALPWDHARHAVHAAWAKLSQDIGARDPDHGIRGAI